MATKTYYAASHYYGTEFSNDYCTLYRFATKAERDQSVGDRNDEEGAGSYKTEALTRNEARRHFPNAFRMVGDFHEVSDERDWRKDDGDTYEYWHADNIYL